MDQCCSTRSGLNPSRVHLDTRDEINLILGFPPLKNKSFVRLTTASGLQHSVIEATTPFGLPENFKIMPELLKDCLGYRTHGVGKWHLGHHRQQFLPTDRGFESHFGFWTGKKDYLDHSNLNQVFGGKFSFFIIFLFDHCLPLTP